MILRSAEDKLDLARSWGRPDRPFFASGACHVLAGVFLEEQTGMEWHALHIRPADGFRGGHVVVSNGTTILDYHGYTSHNAFLRHYLAKVRRLIPHWSGTVDRLADSPISKSFCRRTGHRLPEQFLHDPRPRARGYLRRIAERSPSTLGTGGSSL